MILFFPGTGLADFERAQSPEGVGPIEVADIDHFSLEPKLDQWHVTGKGQQRKKRLPVRGVGDKLVAWFGLSVQSPDFEPLYREMEWSFPCPAKDVARRKEEIRQAHSRTRFHLFKCGDSREENGGPSFWHFEVSVYLGSPADGEIPPFLPPRPPFSTLPDSPAFRDVHWAYVQIPGFSGTVSIAAARLSGTIGRPGIVTIRVPR
jgi:hypothetical protein